MKRLTRHFRDFLLEEDGPAAVEYALMLALILIVIFAAVTALGTTSSSLFTNPDLVNAS